VVNEAEKGDLSLFSRKCPKCGGSVREMGFKGFLHRLKARSHDKRYFRCCSCNSEYILEEGNLMPFSEVNWDTVYCSYCGKELDYKTCHKESSDCGPIFSCRDCLKKSIRNWLILIAIITIGMIIAWQFGGNR
jgi:hypothetical protein